MDYVTLGRTALQVSQLALGSGNFGTRWGYGAEPDAAAAIEKSRDFTLVPWRPMLERQIGNQVSGIVRNDTANWTIGRARGGPSF